MWKDNFTTKIDWVRTFRFATSFGFLLLFLATVSVAGEVNGVGGLKIKRNTTRGESYEERQERLDREKQMQQDQDQYLERWRANQTAPKFTSIAYSDSTDRWGFAWGKSSQGSANVEASKRCGVGAKVLCWSKGTWYCALATGPRSYGAAPGATASKAKAEALRLSNNFAPGAHIVLVVGGNPATIWQN